MRRSCTQRGCNPLSLTDVHSFAQTNEFLSYVSVCYETVTWEHCVPFPISSFTDKKNMASIFRQALVLKQLWRTHRRTQDCFLLFNKKAKRKNKKRWRPLMWEITDWRTENRRRFLFSSCLRQLRIGGVSASWWCSGGQICTVVKLLASFSGPQYGLELLPPRLGMALGSDDRVGGAAAVWRHRWLCWFGFTRASAHSPPVRRRQIIYVDGISARRTKEYGGSDTFTLIPRNEMINQFLVLCVNSDPHSMMLPWLCFSTEWCVQVYLNIYLSGKPETVFHICYSKM